MKANREIRSAVVTGATCALGIALIQTLLREGVRVTAVVRRQSAGIGRIPAGAGVVFCDMAEIETLPSLVGEPADAFFHLAWGGVHGGRADFSMQIGNIRQTVAAAEAAAALGASVFVGAGSQAEYGRSCEPLRPDTPCRPETAYGAAKCCAGEMSRMICRQHHIDHVWMRVLSLYGAYDSATLGVVTGQLLAGEKPSLTGCEQRWDYLYTGDAADAFLRAARYGADGAVYPLGSGRSAPLRWYFETLRDTIDPDLPLGFGEIPYGENQLMYLQADLTALSADTGFVPKTAFEDGIRQTVVWAKEYKRRSE